MPRSIAVRMIRMLSVSDISLKPMCQPPSPIADTCALVRPSTRYGISGKVSCPDDMTNSSSFSYHEAHEDSKTRRRRATEAQSWAVVAPDCECARPSHSAPPPHGSRTGARTEPGKRLLQVAAE